MDKEPENKEINNQEPEKKEKKKKPPTLSDLLRNEIAEELGLSHKVEQEGWKGLTSRESGRIGGIMSNRKKQLVSMICEFLKDKSQQ